MRHFTLSHFSYLLFTVLLLGCSLGHQNIISVDPQFHHYIAGYSSGMQARTETFRLELQELPDSAAMAEFGAQGVSDAKLIKDIFNIEPKVAGKVVWKNDRVLEFVPDKPLISGELYTVRFALDRVSKVKRGYENFSFQVATFQQKLELEEHQLEVFDDYNLNWYKLSGSFSCSDLADSAGMHKIARAKMNGMEYPVRIVPNYYSNALRFYVDSLPRKVNEQELLLTWDGESINSKSSGELKIKVPSSNDFHIMSAVVLDNGDQEIALDFSEPISGNQDFTGIIDLLKVEGERFSVSHNRVHIYLPNRLVGEFTLKVNAGLRNTQNFAMRKGTTRTLNFNASLPRVRIQGDGNILPDSKGLIFPFESIALKSVTVRIQKIYENNVHHFLQVNNLNGSDELLRFGKTLIEKKVNLKVGKGEDQKWTMQVLDLEKWIRPEQGALYRIGIKFGQEDASCDCPKEDENDESVGEKNSSWSEDDWESYYWDEGYDNWDEYSEDGESASACSESYYRGKAHTRTILASNIGVIFKLGADKVGHAFVTDMLTAQALPNAQVEYVDYTKQLIASATSDANGMTSTKLSRKPFLLVVKNGKQRAYLKLGDGHSNSLSKFDVEGEEVQNDIKGYIYGERGVWRPGDSLYLNFVLQDAQNKLPKNHPVQFTLTNPNDQIIVEKTATISDSKHFDFRTATQDNAPTGSYLAKVTIGKREFTKTIRVETVKPNRLKMKLKIAPQMASDSSELVGTWLHGAVAKKLRANVMVDFRPGKTRFSGFEAYAFDSPVRQLKSNNQTVYDAELDEKGVGKFKMKLSEIDEAPGMLTAIYTTRIFENGGNYSIDRKTESFSPYEQYVGLAVPDKTGNGQLTPGKKHRFEVALLNEEGKKITTETPVRVKIYRMEWRWWYEQNQDDLIHFLGRNGNQIVYDTLLTTQAGAADFRFGIEGNSYGRFLLLVTDEKGKHQTGSVLSIDHPYWSQENGRTNELASMLHFSCNKKSYIKGETVHIRFPSPSVGKALISVETRQDVVKKFWVNTVQGETTCSFQTTAEMAPNAYVHVTLIQPHSATVNHLPIRMYGIVPILVDDPATHLHPVVKTAESWKPESKVSVKVSEQSGQAMTYTLAVVDDGLLDLTRFQTPNPWNSFFAKEALQVRTWDMYNDVIGAFSGKLDRLLSIGGDGSADEGAGPKANRFKPMVVFAGPFTLPANGSTTHQIDIPNYVGSVRVMVVAHNAKSYGSAEETILVKKPLMVLGTQPRTLKPGDKLLLPVAVFAMEKEVKNVEITVQVNDMIVLKKGNKRSLTFSEIGDEMVYFDLEVAEKMGLGKIEIKASSGKFHASQTIEIDVKSPNPPTIETQVFALKPGQTVKVPVEMNGLPGSHKLMVELSQFPSINLNGRMQELIQYPYGCIEQTTSAVFPQLLANDLMDFPLERKKEISKNVSAGLRRYMSFQTVDGGFAYWPGQGEASEWGSNYAGHFIVEADQRGYSLPNGLKERWIQFQKDRALKWENNGNHIAHAHGQESNQLIQSYRLFTLALAGKPEIGAMNRLREIPSLGLVAKWRLAAAYQLAGNAEVAKKITASLSTDVPSYRELGYSYGSDLRDEAMILESIAIIQKSKGEKLKDKIAKKLSGSQWMSTQETGYCLLAIVGKANSSSKGVQGYISGLGISGGSVQTNRAMLSSTFTENQLKGNRELLVENKGNSTLYLTVNLEKVSKKGLDKTENKQLNLTVRYTDLNGQALDPSKIKQGEDFVAIAEIKNPTKDMLYKEMCLQQLFPSGWEIHNTRYMDGEGAVTSDYQDIRDSEVYSFFDLRPLETKQFKIQLNASYKGSFYLPAVYTEAMYNRSIHAQEKGRWVEVF